MTNKHSFTKTLELEMWILQHPFPVLVYQMAKKTDIESEYHYFLKVIVGRGKGSKRTPYVRLWTFSSG